MSYAFYRRVRGGKRVLRTINLRGGEKGKSGLIV